jgi:hypothetical protein
MVGEGMQVMSNRNRRRSVMPMSEQEKLKILLAFWAEHNLEHAQEFRKWAQRALSFGAKEVASKLEAAAEELKALNKTLHAAQGLLAGSTKTG